MDQQVSETPNSLGKEIRKLSGNATILLRLHDSQNCWGSGIGSKYLLLAALFATLFAPATFAQEEEDLGHSDIEFGFEDPSNPEFEIELAEVTDEDIQVAEGSFVRAGSFATTDTPGFITPVSDTENLTVRVGEQVFVRVLDASAPDSPTDRGVGYDNFYNPETDALESLDSTSGTLEITGSNNVVSTFAGDQLISGDAEVFLGEGSDGTVMSDVPPSLGEDNVILGPGEIHNHLAFDLSGDLATTNGAIGILVQFTTVPADGSAAIESAPYFMIFNNQLDEEVFEGPALAAFGLIEEILGDVSGDGTVDFGDIPAFIAVLQANTFEESADINGDGQVDFGDIPGFINILTNA